MDTEPLNLNPDQAPRPNLAAAHAVAREFFAAVLPDVQPGERLTGLYQPGLGMRLWRGQQALGAIDDAELARKPGARP